MIQCDALDVTVVKQFFPEAGTIQVHQLRVCPCLHLPIGYYWYGRKRHSCGKTPGWVEKLLSEGSITDGRFRDKTSTGNSEASLQDTEDGVSENIASDAMRTLEYSDCDSDRNGDENSDVMDLEELESSDDKDEHDANDVRGEFDGLFNNEEADSLLDTGVGNSHQ